MAMINITTPKTIYSIGGSGEVVIGGILGDTVREGKHMILPVTVTVVKLNV
jgi:hypothetical protein